MAHAKGIRSAEMNEKTLNERQNRQIRKAAGRECVRERSHKFAGKLIPADSNSPIERERLVTNLTEYYHPADVLNSRRDREQSHAGR